MLSAVAFYALDGHEFDYDRDIKRSLKTLATDEASVDSDETVATFASQAAPFRGSGTTGTDSLETVLRREFRRQRYKRDENGDR